MEILKKFGERLRELRQERNLKQREITNFLKMTLRNYQRMEHGEINIPTLTLCTLADGQNFPKGALYEYSTG